MAHANEESIKSLYPDVLVVEADGKAYISSGVEKTVDANAIAVKKVQLARAAAYPSLQEQTPLELQGQGSLEVQGVLLAFKDPSILQRHSVQFAMESLSESSVS